MPANAAFVSPTKSGFTLIELVLVIIVLSILAAVALAKFTGRSAFDARGYADRVTGIVQFAQKTAIAQRRNVCVNVAGGVVSVQKAATANPGVACTINLVDPATGAAFSAAAPSAVTITASISPIIFDALGQSVNAAGAPLGADATVTVASTDLSVTVTVEKVTGYVR